jgi:hypothetical protein
MSDSEAMGIDLARPSHIVFFCVTMLGASIALAKLTALLLEKVLPGGYIFLVDSAGPLGWYALLYALFGKWAWKWNIWRLVGVVVVPDLSGSWHGEFRSERGDESGPPVVGEARVEVVQTFQRVTVFGYFEESNSVSELAGFVRSGNEEWELAYIYKNEPRIDSTRTMHAHQGAARVRVADVRRALEGSYFTWSRDGRGTVGTLHLKFQGNRLKRALR